MIVERTFVHEARVLRRRKRNAETVSCAAKVLVDVPEVTGEEAPVVLTMRDDRSFMVGVASMSGRHVRQDHLGFLVDVPMVGADVLATLTSRLPGGGTRDCPSVDDIPDVSHVYGHDRDEREAEVREAASDLVLVDGRPWNRIQEPFLVVDDRRDRVVVTLHVNDTLPEGNARGIFRLDEADLVAKCFPGKPCSMPRFGLGPAFVPTLPVFERFAADSARFLLKDMEARLGANDVAYFQGFKALQAALGEAKSSLDAGERPPMAALVGAISEACALDEAVMGGRHWIHRRLADRVALRFRGDEDLAHLAAMAP